MSVSRRTFLISAVALAPALAALPAMAADTALDITLWDNMDMDMVTGLTYGSGGDMSLANMGIKVSQSTVPAGNVTFNVTNVSNDLEHEMVIAPVAVPGTPLPFNADISRVMEDEAGNLGEVADLEPGDGGTLTLDLVAGLYILYCNVPGHYEGGMWTMLNVM